jgi:hypothetical protein
VLDERADWALDLRRRHRRNELSWTPAATMSCAETGWVEIDAYLLPRSGAQWLGGDDGHLAVTIDRDDLAWERARLAKEISERAAPVGRADDRVRVGVGLDAIAFALALVKEGCKRVTSELLLVAFSAHGPFGESVAPPSFSQSRTARSPIAAAPGAILAGSREGSAGPERL